jgi:hypothetical protein
MFTIFVLKKPFYPKIWYTGYQQQQQQQHITHKWPNFFHKLTNVTEVPLRCSRCIFRVRHSPPNFEQTFLNIVYFLLGNSPASEVYMPTFRNTLFPLQRPMKIEQCVPKRRHIKFRRRRITQKKTYNIQNTAKVWNQEYFLNVLSISGVTVGPA